MTQVPLVDDILLEGNAMHSYRLLVGHPWRFPRHLGLHSTF
jgi:hypothetical protein